MPASSDEDESIAWLFSKRSRFGIRWRRCLACGLCGFTTVYLLTRPNAYLDAQVGLDNSADVRLLVIGDWGRCAQHTGTTTPPREGKEKSRPECENQTRLVPVFAAAAKALDAQAVLNVGDSFYGAGMDFVGDDTFYKSFTQVYSRQEFPELDIPWHSIMGNHDHRSKNISCYLDPALRQIDPRWHAYIEGSLVFPPVGKPLVEVVLFDTTPFDEKYLNQAGAQPGDKKKHPFTEQWKRLAHPRFPASWRKELQAQLDRLEQRLAASRQRNIPWLIVMGHNPIRSGGDHSDDPALVALLDPLLWKYGVHAYLNGHDHHMEHIECPRCCEFRHAPPVSAGGTVILNEALDDDAGEWVELYNAGTNEVSLLGWSIHTESDYPEIMLGSIHKVILPGEFLTVNMKMKDGSDHLRLMNAESVVISELAWSFGEVRNGYSIGRPAGAFAEDSSAMVPSEGRANNEVLRERADLPRGASPTFNASGWLPASPKPPHDVFHKHKAIHYFTVGNGAGLGKHTIPTRETTQHSKFFQRLNGFMTIQASSNELVLSFVDEHGIAPHKVQITA